MKTIKSILVALCCIVALSLLLLSCSKSSSNTPTPVTPQTQTTELLIGGSSTSSTPVPWKLQSSSVDGVDKTALYNGFAITFTSSGFTTTNGGAIWPASGKWSFQGTGTTTIVRNDGVSVQIQVSSTSLVMTVAWTSTTLGSGRTESTSGNNVFTMTH
jgi:hypothetical protein